ncbi:hypothetical protein CJ030_MR3G007329 [Morella rubra]|uniref:Protein EXORDIUM n=1 Tax=Morella rubra TaxID=262757 RepID=A0A6A1W7R4_9ROSI|nr:hypothetical protein CJ030_MR3G007329 [Morella rubra]
MKFFYFRKFNLIWNGKFTPSQRAIISDFILSLSSSAPKTAQPSVATWWKATDKYYQLMNSRKLRRLILSLCNRIMDKDYSMGKLHARRQIELLAAKGRQENAINVVLTSADVAVNGFCSICGTHGFSKGKIIKGEAPQVCVHLGWQPATQCPAQCAWPFHQPMNRPKSPSLVAPNKEVGLDGMVINLARLLAGTATTNPFGNGYFTGPKEDALEAGSACPGMYGLGAYPGYAGELSVDPRSGASYNANVANRMKHLLSALFDPFTNSCSPLGTGR